MDLDLEGVLRNLEFPEMYSTLSGYPVSGPSWAGQPQNTMQNDAIREAIREEMQRFREEEGQKAERREREKQERETQERKERERKESQSRGDR